MPTPLLRCDEIHSLIVEMRMRWSPLANSAAPRECSSDIILGYDPAASHILNRVGLVVGGGRCALQQSTAGPVRNFRVPRFMRSHGRVPWSIQRHIGHRKRGVDVLSRLPLAAQ